MRTRASIAGCMAILVVSFVGLSAIVDCPFLRPVASSKSPCCPRLPQPASDRCPLTTTPELCPYFVTEAKLGICAVKVEVAATATQIDVFQPPGWAYEPVQALPGAPVDHGDVYLRNRVLLI